MDSASSREQLLRVWPYLISHNMPHRDTWEQTHPSQAPVHLSLMPGSPRAEPLSGFLHERSLENSPMNRGLVSGLVFKPITKQLFLLLTYIYMQKNALFFGVQFCECRRMQTVVLPSPQSCPLQSIPSHSRPPTTSDLFSVPVGLPSAECPTRGIP